MFLFKCSYAVFFLVCILLVTCTIVFTFNNEQPKQLALQNIDLIGFWAICAIVVLIN
jgi:hypothetical protein